MRIDRGPGELQRRLIEQVMCMEVSAHYFDTGMHWEARRLATAIRVLCHEGSYGKSLLRLLKIKDQLRYASAVDMTNNPTGKGPTLRGGRFVSGPSTDEPAVFAMEMQPGMENGTPSITIHWKPVLKVAEHVKSFDTWWDAPVVAAGGRTYRRWDFIRWLANQDGGAHVDSKVEAEYAALADGSTQIVAALGMDLWTAENPALAIVRTIAFELIVTLQDQAPGLLPLVEAASGPVRTKFVEYPLPEWIGQTLAVSQEQ